MFEPKSNTEYRELPQDHSSIEGSSVDLNEAVLQLKPRSLRDRVSLSLCLLFISVIINGFFVSKQLFQKPNCVQEPSRYGKSQQFQLRHNLLTTKFIAGLKRNIPIALYEDKLFDSRNITEQDATWEDWESGTGVVALSDEYIKEKSLPPAQRWPWDRSKSLYFTHGHHNLHCLVHPPRQNFNYGIFI